MRLGRVFLLAFVILVLFAQSAGADSIPSVSQEELSSTRYRLVEGSTLVVDYRSTGAPDEDAPPILELPITGRFLLRPVTDEASPSANFRHFEVSDLEFKPTGGLDRYWGHDGKGRYMLGDDSTDPRRQRMTLELAIDRCAPLYFDSGFVPVPEGIRFPWIDIKLAQLEPYAADCPRFGLRLVATPWPDTWFSTETSFTSGSSGHRVGDGDLLSATGQVVRTNPRLLARFRPGQAAKDYGLDAVIGPPLPDSPDAIGDAQIWFSTEVNVRTQSPYEILKHGDLLSDLGWVVRRNEELLGPFVPMPATPDVGLDALALDLRPSAEAADALLFSTEDSFFSEKLGVLVSHGDLLHADGRILRTNAQLMANFDPVVAPVDGFGLDAVYVWPHGEIWFSTEVDFRDARWGLVRHGDLLSNMGRVVVRNHDLMAPFEPLEDLADFGLDAMWVLGIEDDGRDSASALAQH
jgi:hypothetical protein